MIRWFESTLSRIAAAYAPDLRFLAIIRISFGLATIFLTGVTRQDVTWVGEVPAAFFHARPGLFYFLTGPPDNSFLIMLMAAKITLGILLIVGIWTLPVSVLLSAALMTSSGISYSYSKLDHLILFEITPVFLAVAGWGWKWSADALLHRKRSPLSELSTGRGMPILLFAMTIGWGMLTAAAPKAAGGWLDPSRYATRAVVARHVLLEDQKIGPLWSQAFGIDNGVFWKFLDFSTVIIEAGLIFVVFIPLAFRLWLLFLTAFHVGVYLVLGINFVPYAFVYIVFFSPVFVWIATRVGHPTPPVRQESTSSTAAVDRDH